MSEEALPGGRTTPGVVRVGDTVRRPRGGRAEFAASALTWLNEQGFPFAPRYLGIDEDGRDTFAYIPGDTTDHPSQRHEDAYADIASILRLLHRLSSGADFTGPGSDCLLHGDPGPFNVVMQQGRPVALIDWDSVRLGDRLEDVGYAAWTWCVQSTGNVAIEDQARRLRLFRDAYDRNISGDAMLEAVLEQQSRIACIESTVVNDLRHTTARRDHAQAATQWALSDQRLVREHRPLFTTALSG